MKTFLPKVVMIASALSLIGCGKITTPSAPATTNNQTATVSQQLQAFNASPQGRAAANSDGSGADYANRVAVIIRGIESYLDLTYGSNANVSKVVTGGLGFTGVYITPQGTLAGASHTALFEKNTSGKFKLISGTPMYVKSINANLLTLFVASGYVPLVAGAGAFCAGLPSKTHQSGAVALGLSISARTGQLYPVAGAIVRSGSQYQACSLQGCTPVSTTPIPVAANYPICDALLK